MRDLVAPLITQVSSLTTRVDTMDRDRSTVAATLSEHERRLGALAVPEQLEVLKRIKVALEENLQQTVNWLEWFTRQSTKVRNLVDGVREDLSPAPGQSDAQVGIPDVAGVLKLIGGKPGGEDEAKLQGLLKMFGAP